MRLDKDRGDLGVKAAGHEEAGGVFYILPQRHRVLGDGQRVQINHTKEIVGFMLQVDEVFDRAEVIAERQRTAGLDAGKNTFLHLSSSLLIVRAGFINGLRRLLMGYAGFINRPFPGKTNPRPYLGRGLKLAVPPNLIRARPSWDGGIHAPVIPLAPDNGGEPSRPPLGAPLYGRHG